MIDLITEQIDPKVVHLLPEEVVRRYKALPLKLEGNILEVAMVNPDNLEALDEIKLLTGCEVKPQMISENQLRGAIEKHFRVEESTRQALVDLRFAGLRAARQKAVGFPEEISRTEEQPVVKLMNSIINGAITARASDIHLEPQEPEMRVRYRIDGVLHDAMTIPKPIESPLVSRAKIMAHLDIAEKRRPQDGHIAVKFQGKIYDLRVSSLPTVAGEKIVLRILDKSTMLLGLNQLGLSGEEEKLIKTLIAKPFGMIFVTGPTGCGKTTTLYALLNSLNTTADNIITIEDPVEYRLTGINQIQVNPTAGITFATGLRSILRQDPNIIMVGEVRDLETAEIAVHAALTGHLVLSTLHTNDAPSAITRLLDMGVEPFLISSTVVGIIAQRLVRLICRECQGKGCTYCYQTGLKGRTGIFEAINITDALRKLIQEQAPASAIKELASKEGMKTLARSGEEKVKAGICTPQEIKRVVYAD